MKFTFFVLIACFFVLYTKGQNDTLKVNYNDTLSDCKSDTYEKYNSGFTLLDSLRSPIILQSIFNPTTQLTGACYVVSLLDYNQPRDLPFLKQIKPRIVNENNWKIWYILGILFYLALVRLSNIRNFELSTAVVFDLLFLSTINRLKDAKFTLTSLHLFVIYILSFSLILTQFFENNQIFNNYSYKILVWIIALGIVIIYLIKFLIYFVVGYLLNDMISSTKMVINTIQISNFLSFVLLIFAVFYIYTSGLQLTQTIFFSMVAIFFTAILYRIIRYLLNQISSSSLPFFYLFIYLCALEISPWLIFIKILNSYLS